VEGIKTVKKYVKQVALKFCSSHTVRKLNRSKLKSISLSVDSSKHFSDFSLPENSTQSLNLTSQNFVQQNNSLDIVISQKQDFPSISLIAPDQNIFSSIQQQEPSSKRNEKKEQIALREFNSLVQSSSSEAVCGLANSNKDHHLIRTKVSPLISFEINI
jgi:hypothetical protein